MNAPADTQRDNLERFAAAVTSVVVAAPYVVGRLPFSNIDEYTLRPYARDFFGTLVGTVASEPTAGRFRPLYWVFEGALGAVTGSTATILYYGRLAFLALTVALVVRSCRRLGAPLLLAVLLAAAVAWSGPAFGVWGRGGPAEAFATPLALAACLLVLAAERPAGLLLAAGVGLAACLVKETYAAWTGGALVAWAIWAFGSGARRNGAIALGGAAIQFLPAVYALVVLPAWSGSYAQHAVEASGVGPAQAALSTFEQVPLLVALGVGGLVLVLVRMARAGRRAWGVEDLVAAGMALAVVVQSVALGFMVNRYLLPLVVVLALVAGRAASGLERLARSRLALAALVIVIIPAVAAAGYRGALAVQVRGADARGDERFRQVLREELMRSGAAKILWYPPDVERPLGALAHLEADGVKGKVQMLPCSPYPLGQEPLLASYFAPYGAPVPGSLPFLVSTRCPGVRPPLGGERACVLELPSITGPAPGIRCFDVPEKAIVFGGG